VRRRVTGRKPAKAQHRIKGKRDAAPKAAPNRRLSPLATFFLAVGLETPPDHTNIYAGGSETVLGTDIGAT
jgi:hypothetical protein